MLNDVLKLVALTEFKPFTQQDYWAFSGASEDAMIGYYKEQTIIIDCDDIVIVPDPTDENPIPEEIVWSLTQRDYYPNDMLRIKV